MLKNGENHSAKALPETSVLEIIQRIQDILIVDDDPDILHLFELFF